MITGNENIAGIFSIFHDGEIVHHSYNGNDVTLQVKIDYLACRLNPEFSKFTVNLSNFRNVEFRAWQNITEPQSNILTTIEKIFKPKLEILECNVKDDFIEIVCNQHSNDYIYWGGELRFQAEAATVLDESGREYSLEELDKLCHEYWDEWAHRGENE